MTPPELHPDVIARLTPHKSSVYSVHFSPSENVFFSGSSDGLVYQWNIGNYTEAKLVAKISGTILSLCYIPESSLLLIGQLQGGLHVLDLKIKQEIKHLVINQKGIFDIKIRDSKILLAGGEGVLSVLDLKSFDLISKIKLSEKSIRKIDFSDNEIAVGTSDNSISILDAGTFSIKNKLNSHKNSVFSVKYSQDGNFLLSGSRDAHLCVWNAKDQYNLLHSIPAHNYTINDIAFNESGTLFATASRDKSIKLWNTADFSFLKKLASTAGGHLNSVNSIFWNGSKLFSCSDDRSLIVWDVQSQEIL